MIRISVIVALSMLLISPALAGTKSIWKTIDGSFADYYKSKLQIPVSIYIINNNGDLVGVIKTDGKYTSERINNVKHEIMSKDFSRHTNNRKLSQTKKVLDTYLSDQGYSLPALAESENHNIILFVDWSTENLGCDWLARATGRYKAVVSRSFQNLSEHPNRHTFIELSLNAPHMQISCPKAQDNGSM